MSANVSLFAYDCGACSAKFNNVIEVVQPGLPQNVEKIKDFIFQDRPRSER